MLEPEKYTGFHGKNLVAVIEKHLANPNLNRKCPDEDHFGLELLGAAVGRIEALEEIINSQAKRLHDQTETMLSLCQQISALKKQQRAEQLRREAMF